MESRKDFEEQNYDPSADPRRFKFALYCLNCDYCCNTLKDMANHTKNECPYPPPVKLFCGHCELRISNWPRFVRHLNQPGMHLAGPKKPIYTYREPVVPVSYTHLTLPTNREV